MAQSTAALKRLVSKTVPLSDERVEWCGEYLNENIVADVFNKVDAIVVPSIWVENSPLVIHEALQAGVLVVTGDVGGMAEYVHHDENGLLFKHRDVASLAQQMQRCLDEPAMVHVLASKGYPSSVDGQIPCIKEHVQDVVGLYRRAIEQKQSASIISSMEEKRAPFWRVTFDTSPDDCNLHCTMCEGFSEYSSVARLREIQGLPPRRMPVELMERVLVQLVDMNIAWARETGRCQALEVIPSTMGEPLLWKGFERLLEVLSREKQRYRKLLKDFPCSSSIGLPPPGEWVGLYLNLTTNGTFPRLGVERWADLILPHASDIKISWNGATAKTQEAIMKGQHYEQVLSNVRQLAKKRDELSTSTHRVRLTFQLTFLEDNYEEIPDIIRLAHSLGIDRVKGHHLWVHWKAMENQRMTRSDDSVARWNKMVPSAKTVARELGVTLEGVSEVKPGALQCGQVGAPCPFLGREAWISAEGRFNPCCAPDEQRMSLGYLGNLHEDSLSEIADSELYRSLLATYSSKSLCQSCNMRRWPTAKAPDTD
eukprot:TRINITY_DN41003_c0_g1_i2.p1 TRINITY_DN41003_c0_g1~~TRINITY_DN41003_c0_g1_i2.p1  ORF type:complete len:539 (+),score=88.71 TRINITY_DN41003_c0_g1_i2:322-1938(+)